MDDKKNHRVRPCGGMDCEARGFTLIELLAVISIIALLAALGSLGYRLASHDAKSAAALADMETLRLALEEHRALIQQAMLPPQSDRLDEIASMRRLVG